MKSFRCTLLVLFLFVGLNSYGNTINNDSTSYISSTYSNNRQESLLIKFTGSTLVIENLPKDDIMEIYNIMGAKVYTRRINSGTNEYQLTLPRGYYIIKIGKFTKKIAVR